MCHRIHHPLHKYRDLLFHTMEWHRSSTTKMGKKETTDSNQQRLGNHVRQISSINFHYTAREIPRIGTINYSMPALLHRVVNHRDKIGSGGRARCHVGEKCITFSIHYRYSGESAVCRKIRIQATRTTTTTGKSYECRKNLLPQLIICIITSVLLAWHRHRKRIRERWFSYTL